MFKKGSFEIGGTIYPAAIKVLSALLASIDSLFSSTFNLYVCVCRIVKTSHVLMFISVALHIHILADLRADTGLSVADISVALHSQWLPSPFRYLSQQS